MDTETDETIRTSAEQLKLFVPQFLDDATELVMELRALQVPQRYGAPKTTFGFFELTSAIGKQAFWDAIRGLVAPAPEFQPEGIYLTLNPVNAALLARANNRVKVARDKGLATSDEDVIARHWVVIDVDPLRPAKISATDAEKAAARIVADNVREDLRIRGWPDPLVIDSGNGFHLWYRTALPIEDGGLVERTLKALASHHDSAAAKIDTSMFNPSRIAKLPGTWARKGDSIPERPHRLARVLEVPS